MENTMTMEKTKTIVYDKAYFEAIKLKYVRITKKKFKFEGFIATVCDTFLTLKKGTITSIDGVQTDIHDFIWVSYFDILDCEIVTMVKH